MRLDKVITVLTVKISPHVQKLVARTEQEILNRIKEKEIHVTELKKKLAGVQVGHCVYFEHYLKVDECDL